MRYVGGANWDMPNALTRCGEDSVCDRGRHGRNGYFADPRRGVRAFHDLYLNLRRFIELEDRKIVNVASLDPAYSLVKLRLASKFIPARE